MKTGELRHRITIQEKSVTRASNGEENETWASIATVPEVWAKVEPLRGREFFAAQETQSSIDYRITIRYRSDLDRTMRVVWGSETLDIVSVIPVRGEHKWLELMCASGVRNAR